MSNVFSCFRVLFKINITSLTYLIHGNISDSFNSSTVLYHIDISSTSTFSTSLINTIPILTLLTGVPCDVNHLTVFKLIVYLHINTKTSIFVLQELPWKTVVPNSVEKTNITLLSTVNTHFAILDLANHRVANNSFLVTSSTNSANWKRVISVILILHNTAVRYLITTDLLLCNTEPVSVVDSVVSFALEAISSIDVIDIAVVD